MYVNCTLTFDVGEYLKGDVGYTINESIKREFSTGSIDTTKEAGLGYLQYEIMQILFTDKVINDGFRKGRRHIINARLTVKENKRKAKEHIFYLKKCFKSMGRLSFSGIIHRAKYTSCWV
ncbi:hypothetical protein KJ750_03455 [Patescibacteria group bacterium]|nr:hypothetical protein [Patescibacteria group bacterium]